MNNEKKIKEKYKQRVMSMKIPIEFVINKLNKENILNNKQNNNVKTNGILYNWKQTKGYNKA